MDDSSHLWHLIVSYISPNLLTGLLERLEDYGNRGPGLLLWMALMDEVTSGSPQAMDSILENFKKIQLSDYPGENVRLMVHDIQASFNLLKSGQCLPITASSIVATKLLLCQVEEFRAVFYTISVKIDTEERGLMGKDNAALVKFQATPSGVKTLLDMALTQYKRLIDNGRWPPSQTVPKKQSDSLPDAFQATVFPTAFQAVADELKAIRKDFETKPSGAGQDLSKTTCYKCGKIGHLRPNCPDKTTTYPENSWQNVPPTDGKFSMTKDGRQWHWCNKCRGGEGCWSTTHGTETHKGSPKTVTFTAVANLAGVAEESPAEDGVLMYNPAGFVASCYDHDFDWSSIEPPDLTHHHLSLEKDEFFQFGFGIHSNSVVNPMSPSYLNLHFHHSSLVASSASYCPLFVLPL